MKVLRELAVCLRSLTLPDWMDWMLLKGLFVVVKSIGVVITQFPVLRDYWLLQHLLTSYFLFSLAEALVSPLDVGVSNSNVKQSIWTHKLVTARTLR